ncbi:hypothetical protein HDU93_005459 [Gonapodya sp. JEL0774]|nr:hypothetical protein HDU93_005459 [Gonapodya sp. JEL0774]
MPPYPLPEGLPNAIRGFVQRAEELRSHEPVIAYYCKNILISSIGRGCQMLFVQPTGEFYAARKAMEIQQKLSYSRWKAVDIEKALKEGRKPTPGPAGSEGVDELELQNPANPSGQSDQNVSPPPGIGSSEGYGLLQQPGYPMQGQPFPPTEYRREQYPGENGMGPQQPYVQFPAPPSYPSSAAHYTQHPQPQSSQQPNSYGAKLSGPKLAGGAPSPSDLYPYDPKVLASAQKLSRFAISALQYDDIETAVDNLQKALMLLQPYSRR